MKKYRRLTKFLLLLSGNQFNVNVRNVCEIIKEHNFFHIMRHILTVFCAVFIHVGYYVAY